MGELARCPLEGALRVLSVRVRSVEQNVAAFAGHVGLESEDTVVFSQWSTVRQPDGTHMPAHVIAVDHTRHALHSPLAPLAPHSQ